MSRGTDAEESLEALREEIAKLQGLDAPQELRHGRK